MSLNLTQISPMFITLPAAAVVHGAIILGTGFGLPEPNVANKSTLLDITIVRTESDTAPKEADYVAQSNQQGSGSLKEKSRITSPFASDNPSETDGDQMFASEETAPDIVIKPEPKILTTKGQTNNIIKKQIEEDEVKEPKVVSQDISEKAEEIATLMAEMNKDEKRYAKRPRIHFVDSISAKSAVEAEYIQNWAKKLERIGNINFPEEAIRLSLSGTLILNATLDRAGRVVEMEITVSSGNRTLDKAALRIVKLAAPYQPLPAEVRKKYDRLNITRSIVFNKENAGAAFYTN
ncbi:energy transducer TonB [Leucothrix sargassi]|nr:energy transducer TonB [Leucothrix sargassi]